MSNKFMNLLHLPVTRHQIIEHILVDMHVPINGRHGLISIVHSDNYPCKWIVEYTEDKEEKPLLPWKKRRSVASKSSSLHCPCWSEERQL